MREWREQDEVDFPIVGTGAGGGTLAALLAEQGFSVVAFDAGPYFRPRPAIMRFMDRVLLDMLDRQPERAAPLFASLFERCKPPSLVRFLNDRAGLADLAAVCLAMPFITTTAASLHLLSRRTQCPQTAVAG